MELRDVTNTYIPAVRLNSRYAPVIKRGVLLDDQNRRSSFAARRATGETHIDLWVDGTLYPVDPATNSPPRFSTTKEYLEFLCHGEGGMLGYTRRLSNVDAVMNMQSTIRGLEADVQRVQQEHEAQRCVLQSLSNSRTVLVEERVQLQREVANLEATCEALRISLAVVAQTSHETISSLEADLSRSRASYAKLQADVKFMVETPRGLRKRVRTSSIKSVHELAQGSGNAKRRRTILRAHIQPQLVNELRQSNKARRERKRWIGARESQIATARAIASVLSAGEALKLGEQPRMSKASAAATATAFKKIQTTLSEDVLLGVCDGNNVTHRGYHAFCKVIKHRVASIAPDLKRGLLPSSKRLAELRRKMNNKLRQFIGEYYHVDGRRIIPEVRVAKKVVTKSKEVILNIKNNLFADIEAVQRSMVLFYDITVEECNGGPLIFVLKLDEAEVLHGKKFERVSLTLMNRALDPQIQKNDERYFLVQSEQEIWPVGCFQVEKESYDILQWVFNQTRFPEVIKAQSNGEQLDVPGYGSFPVEWHLSADMKTIKCMYGLQHGPSCKMNCIYCEQQHERLKTCTASEADRVVFSRGKGTWRGGLFAHNIQGPPCDIDTHPRWKPILPIPLSRTHICTLHALVRISEKILHLHFMFVWNMQDEERKATAIDAMEKTMSAIGVEGSNCVLKQDPQLSGKTGNVVQKPSIGGVSASKLFAPSSWSGNDRVWKDVLASESNNLENGQARVKRRRVWETLEALQPYLTGLVLTDEQKRNCRGVMEAFGRAFVAAHGEGHVTHYIHVLVKHGPWFVEKYGSLSVWNCQGMEKSHHAAKASSQYHGQHGGTTSRTSIILQQYEFWYRNIQHRYAAKLQKRLLEAQQTLPDPSIIAATSRRRDAWHASGAREAWEAWRAGRSRQGSRYTPSQASETEEPIGSTEAECTDSQTSIDSITDIT